MTSPSTPATMQRCPRMSAVSPMLRALQVVPRISALPLPPDARCPRVPVPAPQPANRRLSSGRASVSARGSAGGRRTRQRDAGEDQELRPQRHVEAERDQNGHHQRADGKETDVHRCRGNSSARRAKPMRTQIHQDICVRRRVARRHRCPSPPLPGINTITTCVYTFGMAERAKIFMNGGSQAVRLPKSCRFPDDQKEVLVRREGQQVILEPSDEWSQEFLDVLGAWKEPIELPESRPSRNRRIRSSELGVHARHGYGELCLP